MCNSKNGCAVTQRRSDDLFPFRSSVNRDHFVVLLLSTLLHVIHQIRRRSTRHCMAHLVHPYRRLTSSRESGRHNTTFGGRPSSRPTISNHNVSFSSRGCIYPRRLSELPWLLASGVSHTKGLQLCKLIYMLTDCLPLLEHSEVVVWTTVSSPLLPGSTGKQARQVNNRPLNERAL